MTSQASSQITLLEYRKLDLHLNESFAISGGAVDVVELVLVRLTDSAGRVGLGEAAPFSAYDGMTRQRVLDSVKACDFSLLGQGSAQAFEKTQLSWMADRFSGAHLPGPRLAALEMAWLDLLGKSKGLSVSQMLGPESQDPVTGITIVVGDQDHAAESAQRFRDLGFNQIKIKLSGHGLADLERIQQVRQAHPACRILLDANGGFQLDQAREFLRLLEDRNLSVAFLEQPLASDCLAGNHQLAELTRIPILADESCTSVSSLVDCLQIGGFAGVNLKVQKSGVWEAIRMHRAATEAGVHLMIGGMVESPLSMTLSAHLAKALGGFDWVDLDTPLFMQEHPFEGGIQIEGGIVHLGEQPGLGITVTDRHDGFRDENWNPVWQGKIS
jgi:L-alanine-DL-glutamate epimerase-like enolase superfamily enzyme